jgi:hypothetical protein
VVATATGSQGSDYGNHRAGNGAESDTKGADTHLVVLVG